MGMTTHTETQPVSAARGRQLSAIAAFCRDHGFAAFRSGDHVDLEVPWSRRLPDGSLEHGEDVFELRSFEDARRELGY